MPNAANSALRQPTRRRSEAIFELAEASESTARRVSRGPFPNARFGEVLQSTTPQAVGPSDPKRRPSADPGNGAAASDARRVGIRPSRGPLLCAARVRRRRCSGDIGEAWPHRLVQPCSAGLGAAQRQRPGSPAGPSRRAKRRRPGRLGWRRGPSRPGRRRRATLPGAQPSRWRPGWPKAGRRGA